MYALQVLEEREGAAVAAPENEIVEGIKLLAETEGIFTETAGGVVISGLKKLVESGVIARDELTVAFITGNGLKTQEVVQHFADPVHIKPTYESFETAMAGRL
jgi:threonine synthase